MNLMTRLRAWGRNERGEVEDIPAYTIFALATILMICVIIFAGRFVTAMNTIQSAAYSAARDASISREGDAIGHGIAAAERVLNGEVNCSSRNVTITGDGLSTGLGQIGSIHATVTCTVSVSDLIFPGAPGIPGSFTITKTASSPVDPYRAR